MRLWFIYVGIIILSSFLMSSKTIAGGNIWNGLIITEEHVCSELDRDRDYRYSQNLELEIIDQLGDIYSPYTDEYFDSRDETDIDHIVGIREAHVSGLCNRDSDTKSRFANDIRNVTLASPEVNRFQKSDKDVKDWLPPFQPNHCWYVGKVIDIKQAYRLTIDEGEADILRDISSSCSNIEMVRTPR